MQSEVYKMPGYKDWIEQADIKVDYYSAFMKAWIAFNAWYNFSGEIPLGTDRKCIEYIIEHTNRFKTYINNLLANTGTESDSFKSSLAKLHESLLASSITSQEYFGVAQIISFAEVPIKNTNNLHQFDYYTYHYVCKREHGKLITIIQKLSDQSEVFRYEQVGFDEKELSQQSSYNSLTFTQKQTVLSCYRQLIPYHRKNVLCIHPNPNNSNVIKIGNYDFIKDIEEISRAIITVLYMLRCCLAHGDFTPDALSQNVYRYAYEVLLAPLKKLK